MFCVVQVLLATLLLLRKLLVAGRAMSTVAILLCLVAWETVATVDVLAWVTTLLLCTDSISFHIALGAMLLIPIVHQVCFHPSSNVTG